jgi:hypothetical protein
VLEVVVVVSECAAGIVGRIDVDALDPTTVVGKKGLEGFEVVALDEEVVLGGLGVAYYAAIYGRMGVEKTEGDEGCGSEGIFLAGPSQGRHWLSPLLIKHHEKLDCFI